MSVKQDLINYIKFLKSNGYLYGEGVEPVTEAMASDAPAQASASAATTANAESAPATPSPAPIRTATAPAPAPPRRTSATPTNATPPPPLAPPQAAAVVWPPTGPLPAFTEPPLPLAQRTQRLAAAREQAEACRACALGATRHKLVFGGDAPQARIMFVGEAPGGEEDATGIPFVGAAGQLLDKMIMAIGFKRDEVYVANTLKCRPPGNRDPLPAEKQACEHFLLEQIEVVRPAILVALGAHAAQYLCRSAEGIGRLRGRWYDYRGIPLRATYHPSFLLRSPSFKSKSWEDFQAIHAKYEQLHPDDPRAIWQKKG